MPSLGPASGKVSACFRIRRYICLGLLTIPPRDPDTTSNQGRGPDVIVCFGRKVKYQTCVELRAEGLSAAGTRKFELTQRRICVSMNSPVRLFFCGSAFW